MTDPYAVPADAAAGDQTIPLVPEGGYALPAQRPFDETLVDPLAGSDPWASGPGLGWTTPIPPVAAAPAPEQPAAAPSQDRPASPQHIASPAPEAPRPAAYPPPAAYPGAAQPMADPPFDGTTSPQPASAYPQPAPASPPTTPAYPQPAPAYPQPAPAYPQAVPPYPHATPAYPPSPRQPWEAYPEPEGPATSIPGQAYAASPYAGQQQWPATIPDPVNQNYGYPYGFDAATDHPNAIPSLVLGIVGLVLFAPVAPIAWHLGAKGQREARLDPARWRSTGMIAAGRVLGIIGTIILALGAAFVLFVFLAIVAFGV